MRGRALLPRAPGLLRGGSSRRRTRTCARERVDAGVGPNLDLAGGHRVALEALAPVYQDLEGPPLETDVSVVVGHPYAWGGAR